MLSGRIAQDQSEDEDSDYPMTPEDETQLVWIHYEANVLLLGPVRRVQREESFQVERLKTVSDIEMEVVAWDVLVSADQQTAIMLQKSFLGSYADTEPVDGR
jgi:hypothetical protein